MNNKIKYLLNHPMDLLVTLDHRGLLKWMSDYRFLSLLGKSRMGHTFDIATPKTFNEKLNWLKIYGHDSKYNVMADKYLVKSFVTDKIGDIGRVAECYGVWNSFDDIDFDSLPDQFVLKATHDSSGATICLSKDNFDKDKAKKKFTKVLTYNNYYGHREWVYKDVKPRIIAEEYLNDGSGTELQDYKFWCFNGEPRLMYVTNKGKDIYENFYDMDFKPVDVDHRFPRRYPEYECPAEFDEMKRYAAKLSADIPFVRVDFYDIKGKVYFGEFTFYDWAGLRAFGGNWDEVLGSWIRLPFE